MTKLRASSLVLGAMLCAAFASGLYAQNLAPSSAGGGGDDKKPAKTDTKKTPTTEEQVAALAEQMKKMQEVIDSQQQKIDALEKERSFATTGSVPRMDDAENSASKTTRPVIKDGNDDGLNIHIGDATITPTGFVDLTAVFRSRNTGNTTGTNFGSIPFPNQVQGFLSETRLAAINSQLGLKVTGKFGKNDVTGYVEMDFVGNDASNVFVTTNSHTDRMRLFWVDVRRGKHEFVAGQTWSLLTPNRHGLGPENEDVFVTNNIDRSYQVGLVYARQAGFRFIYHPSSRWSVGFAAENPQQYVGVGEVIFPFAYNAQLGIQFDAGNNPGAPNLMPDLIGKVAYDSHGGRIHVETAGFMRAFKFGYVLLGGPGCAPPSIKCSTTTGWGGGGSVNAVIGITDKFRFVSNNFGSAGGGRYIGGLGPDLVVAVDSANVPHIRTVDSYSTLQGFEANAGDKWMFDAYYGASYFRRNSSPDPTNPVPGRTSGFGASNSPNSANRAIQEFTFGSTYTAWRDPKWGALQWLTQGSYVTRSPWFVALGAPTNAHTLMIFTSLRYVFPGKAPDYK
ncbi:MAG TPA: hypothetical protein VGI80_01720 [Pyrinomonadaceae bacterium]